MHGLDERLGESIADGLLPARQGSAVNPNAVASERIFDPKQRHAFADVLHDDVRDQRRCSNRAGDDLVGHGRWNHVGVALGVDRLVPHACDHDAHLRRPPMAELAGFVEAVAFDLAFSDELLKVRVGNLDTLFLQRQLA